MNQYPLIKGKTDLKTRFPEVAAQWDDEKNEGTGPEDVQPASMKKVWWRCAKGHEWRATPDGRLRADPFTGCPYCIGMYAAKGETDLETERTCIGLAKGKGRGGTKLESDQEIGSTVLTVDEQQSFPL